MTAAHPFGSQAADMEETQTITLGNVTVTRVEEMHGPVMPTDQFFPDMPEKAWKESREMLVPDHLSADSNMVVAATQTWVLRSGGRTILVDTGIGNDKARPAVAAWDHLRLDYLGNLARAGVRPEDVDVVVNSHLHADHVGWNTRLVDGTWVPTFPNATYLMPRVDFEYWDPADNQDVVGGVNENAFEDSIDPLLDAGQVQLWEDSHVIDGSLRLAAAPGHTPGHAVIVLESSTDLALFAADIMHTPLQVTHPDHSSCFCLDPALAEATRRRLLGWAADNNALVLPAHLSGHSALEVQHRGSSFTITKWAPFARY
jgi:glyoxylase-like metal-dependent hydrolase (beta-lactamase superfamily II)